LGETGQKQQKSGYRTSIGRSTPIKRPAVLNSGFFVDGRSLVGCGWLIPFFSDEVSVTLTQRCYSTQQKAQVLIPIVKNRGNKSQCPTQKTHDSLKMS